MFYYEKNKILVVLWRFYLCFHDFIYVSKVRWILSDLDDFDWKVSKFAKIHNFVWFLPLWRGYVAVEISHKTTEKHPPTIRGIDRSRGVRAKNGAGIQKWFTRKKVGSRQSHIFFVREISPNLGFARKSALAGRRLPSSAPPGFWSGLSELCENHENINKNAITLQGFCFFHNKTSYYPQKITLTPVLVGDLPRTRFCWLATVTRAAMGKILM